MSSLIKEKFSFPSQNGINTINGFIIRKAEGPYKGIIQISHGMIEHSGWYEHFMSFMAENGYVMAAHDHLGHKMSVNDDSELGFFASKDGYLCVLSDLATTAGRLRKSFPQLKFMLLGHSMGSFYARAFAAKYPHLLDGLIISGTGGPNPLSVPGRLIISAMIKLKGEKAHSKFITKLIFGKYLKRIGNYTTLVDWLSRDNEHVQRCIKDPYRTFPFTLCGYRDLVDIVAMANSRECYVHTNKDIPYLMFAGDEDPVGDWGKGTTGVYEKYKAAGCNIKFNLYPGARHEMLNEINKEQVYNDILIWVDDNI